MMFAIIHRGGKSVRLLPHRYQEDGRYHVSPIRRGPYIPLADERDIPDYLANGYSLGMSGENHGPTMIRPELIEGWVELRQGVATFWQRKKPRKIR